MAESNSGAIKVADEIDVVLNMAIQALRVTTNETLDEIVEGAFLDLGKEPEKLVLPENLDEATVIKVGDKYLTVRYARADAREALRTHVRRSLGGVPESDPAADTAYRTLIGKLDGFGIWLKGVPSVPVSRNESESSGTAEFFAQKIDDCISGFDRTPRLLAAGSHKANRPSSKYRDIEVNVGNPEDLEDLNLLLEVLHGVYSDWVDKFAFPAVRHLRLLSVAIEANRQTRLGSQVALDALQEHMAPITRLLQVQLDHSLDSKGVEDPLDQIYGEDADEVVAQALEAFEELVKLLDEYRSTTDSLSWLSGLQEYTRAFVQTGDGAKDTNRAKIKIDPNHPKLPLADIPFPVDEIVGQYMYRRFSQIMELYSMAVGSLACILRLDHLIPKDLDSAVKAAEFEEKAESLVQELSGEPRGDSNLPLETQSVLGGMVRSADLLHLSNSAMPTVNDLDPWELKILRDSGVVDVTSDGRLKLTFRDTIDVSTLEPRAASQLRFRRLRSRIPLAVVPDKETAVQFLLSSLAAKTLFNRTLLGIDGIDPDRAYSDFLGQFGVGVPQDQEALRDSRSFTNDV